MRIVGRGLQKRFGPLAALRSLDLEVPSGTCMAVLGPNGAGKSTLLRIVAGLTRPSAGTLELDGIALQGRRDASQRGAMALVGHDTQLYAELSARENLVFTGRMAGVPDPEGRAEELLAQEELSHAANRRMGDFSRGMAQRLAIARALVAEPQVVLLDEPFTGLDPPSADRFDARIRAMAAEGRTRLLVTHDLARVSSLADAALVIARGTCAARLSGDQLAVDHLLETMREAAA